MKTKQAVHIMMLVVVTNGDVMSSLILPYSRRLKGQSPTSIGWRK